MNMWSVVFLLIRKLIEPAGLLIRPSVVTRSLSLSPSLTPSKAQRGGGLCSTIGMDLPEGNNQREASVELAICTQQIVSAAKICSVGRLTADLSLFFFSPCFMADLLHRVRRIH